MGYRKMIGQFEESKHAWPWKMLHCWSPWTRLRSGWSKEACRSYGQRRTLQYECIKFAVQKRKCSIERALSAFNSFGLRCSLNRSTTTLLVCWTGFLWSDKNYTRPLKVIRSTTSWAKLATWTGSSNRKHDPYWLERYFFYRVIWNF